MSSSRITDVSDDPTVAERASISAAHLAEARALGFELAGGR
jgi:hypothetical protein